MKVALVVLGSYYAALSLVAFLTFAWDKWAAREGRRRIPEKRLLCLSWLGGFPGAFVASSAFRHKTQKRPFLRWLRWAPWGHFIFWMALVFIWIVWIR